MANLPSGTLSFLFTDLEGSTHLWQEHPESMRGALARHDAILREVIEAHDGHIVKTTGDGVLAVFATASDAVAAAVEAQRAFVAEAWAVPEPLRIRIGIHSGPAELRDGDYYGMAVNRAARIMSIAHGGQTLLSLATSELIRDTGVDLRDLGDHFLRGITGPERVFQLSIPGLRSEFPPLASVDSPSGPIRLPAPAFARGEGFVGRAAALERLESSWQLAREGIRQLVLVAGEPGIGKTRLAAELCERAQAQEGSAILYGRCDEESVVPYQPFIEALRPCLAALPPAVLHERLHGLDDDLARVFPELRDRLAHTTSSAPAAPGSAGGLDESRDTDRYRLFEAITALLAGITATQPVLLVLDDLQWADKPTVLLFRHLIRGVTRAPLLVLGCYRDVDVRRGHTVADLLADLRREPSVTWLPLSGLSEDETQALLSQRAGRDVGARLVSALHHETDGNPFFLEELLRHLDETDGAALLDAGVTDGLDVDDLELPDTIRDVIVRRLRRLPGHVGDALNAAAVVGPEFDALVLARAIGRPNAEILEALDEAATAGLVAEVPRHPGRYAFSHGLFRQALYAELVSARRAQLHHQVGVALEADGAKKWPAATLAHHFLRALALGDREPAVRYATAAGREAAAGLAYEDALRYFEQALELLAEDQSADVGMRAELLIDHADALVYVDEGAGVEAALRAVDASRAAGSALQFARAVTVFVEPALTAAAHPREAVDLFDEAMAALGDDAPALRARLLAILAFKYTTSQLRGRDGRSLADEALRAARATSDAVTLADALLARAVSLEGLPDLVERVALGEELVRLGRTAGARPWSYGLGILAGTQLARGDADELAGTITQLAQLGEEMRWLPAHVHAARWHATQAILEGRFDDARAAGKEMHRYVSAYRGAAGIRGAVLFHLAREEGELGALPSGLSLADQRDNLHGLVMMALAQVDNGDLANALGELAAVASDGAVVADEPAWPSFLAVLTEAAATAGEDTHAAFLEARLTPFAGRLVTVPTGLATLGAADRYLGMLATLGQQWDEGAGHFERALALETKARGWALLPRTRFWYARFLRTRGRPGDDDAARTELRIVDDETARLGMRQLGARSAELSPA